MSWMKHIDLVVNEVFKTETPPATAEQMAEVLRQEGHTEVASYVGRLDENAYDDLKWYRDQADRVRTLRCIR